jgi:RNA polymerase sigma-70 factor (ECF subfamily)
MTRDNVYFPFRCPASSPTSPWKVPGLAAPVSQRESGYRLTLPLTELGRFAQAGCAQALEELLRRVDGPVYRYLVVRLRAAPDAQDLALDLRQEVLIRVVASLGRCTFASDGRLLAWVLTITRNVLLDHLRAARGRGEVRNPPAWACSVAAACDDEPVPPHPLEGFVAETLAGLPEATAELLRLRLIGGRSWKEVGGALGIAESAAKRRFQRAQAALRRQILARVDALPRDARRGVVLRLLAAGAALGPDGAAPRSPDTEAGADGRERRRSPPPRARETPR